ncbi:hypothetical protein NC651_036740 [Populus alba x Populus x berolinensis]|nr:hypothetical protein NC651_036740 [Populus alba x Populus x berolinensis]
MTYPEWLANIVMVKKANEKWRMCVDFKDLNEACLKDDYPLSKIDRLVDLTAGYEFLSSLDAYSRVMLFGLKNAGATYQRMVDKVFKHQLDRIIEGYVDDMLVKSMTFEQHLQNLKEVFQVLEDYSMKLNPFKSVFAIRGGKLLGFLVSHRGIKPNLEKIQVLLGMNPLKIVKEVQRLIGRLATLSSLGTGDNFLEAEGLLSVTLGGGVDKPTSKADSSQTGHVRMTGEMGSGIRRIWNDLSPNPKLLDPRSFRRIFSQDWRLYVDGFSTQEGSGVGILLVILEGQVYQYGLRFGFLATNNVAVYEVVITGLGLAEAL